MNADPSTLEVIVKRVTYEASGVKSYQLRRKDGGDLPAFGAGAHIDLHLAGGLVRSYSLLNDPAQRDSYVVAVALDPNSRGGSKYIHSSLHAGDVLAIGAPRNNFELDEAAAHTVFIAGGIGITPFMAMIHRLEALGRSWELFYGSRSRDTAAFAQELASSYGARVHTRFESEARAGENPRWNIDEIVARSPQGTHFYCCGPAPMLDAYVEATTGVAPGQVHLEYFSAKEASANEGGFDIRLARSQRVIPVLAGRTILDTLLDSGVEVMNSCREGLCGACEVAVLEGTPDHRDSIHSDAERDTARTMFVCVSGCKGKELVLDL